MQPGVEGAAPVAVVTGGGSGIGLATVVQLLGDGWRVLLGDINEEAGHRAVRAGEDAGHDGRMAFLPCDVTIEESVAGLVRGAVDRFGRLDCMVNNAGVPGAYGPITEITTDEWDRTMAILLRSVFLGVKHSARQFERAGTGGSIVSVASVAALSGGVGPQAYSAAKAAVVNLTMTAAVELARHRIRVNAVAPGPVLTPILGEGDRRQARAAELLAGTQPWPEPGLPGDVAAAIAFLAGPASRFVTGETLVVDGGQTAAGPLEAMRRLADPQGKGVAGMSLGSTGQPGTRRHVRPVEGQQQTAGPDNNREGSTVVSKENAAVHQANRDLLTAWTADPDGTLDDMRKTFEDFLADLAVGPDAEFEDVEAGGVPSIWASAPGADASRVIVHFHSGGYVLGSAGGYRSFGYNLSAATGARVLLVDYRLAPEHQHPAAIDDGMAAYRFVLDSGISASRTVISGDSAGGGLCLALLQRIRDEGVPLPSAAISMSPWADFKLAGESMQTNADKDPLVPGPAMLEGMVSMVIGEAGDPGDPRISPLYGDWSGLPPILVTAGSIETLRDDGKRCVAAAVASGVDARFIEGEEMVHIWPIFADRLPEARETLATFGAFVKQHAG